MLVKGSVQQSSKQYLPPIYTKLVEVITAEDSMEYLQDLLIKNKMAYYNYHVLEIIVAEINTDICWTVWLGVS